MNVIDLFCGCGGFSKGFSQAGFNIAYGIDNWKDATVTYKHNFPSAVISNEDITNIRGNEILKATGLNANEIDVIIGGPPCQGFSLSGKRILDDPRNRLYKSFVNIVSDLMPPVFVMENVPGLVRLFDGKVKDAVISDFSELGYDVEMQLLSADNFGVPQQRKRVFFVGINHSKIKNTDKFIFPRATFGEGTDNPAVTCKEAISDLDFIPDDKVVGESIDYQIEPQCSYQKLMRKNSSKVLNHSATMHTEKTKRIIAMVPDGGNYKDLPQELWSTRKVNIAWTRMNSNKPCFTIDTGHNHHFHYKENRVPTVRESARIQSFPDDFEFIGIKTSQLRQVGNAVPPLLAQAIAERVKEVIRKG
ncbi:MAG: DNA cytosine methyltransferase [Clostridiales bacterium]|nr:DNA cytosine methyltransferase [Clostridiales bacterium]